MSITGLGLQQVLISVKASLAAKAPGSAPDASAVEVPLSVYGVAESRRGSAGQVGSKRARQEEEDDESETESETEIDEE